MRVLARDLKAAGSPARGLRLELLRAARLAAKPMAEAAKASALENLPKKGGLNVWVADGAKFAVRNRLATSRGVGVRIVATEGGARLERMDDGKLRHPGWEWRTGRDAKWYDQDIPKGWFTKPLNRLAPVAQAEITMAMNIIGRRLEKGML